MPLVPGNWFPFIWLGVGPIFFPSEGFFLEAAAPALLRVVDGHWAGDAFDVYVNGTLAISTPAVPFDMTTGGGFGDAAWADERLSKGSLLLSPGTYEIMITTRVGSTAGIGFIRADMQHGVVPEPISMVLLGTGLLGIAGVRRQRSRGH